MPRTERYELLLEELAYIDNGKWERIATPIYVLWGSPECYRYLWNLMFDSRDGQRAGFPERVLQIITQLSIEHADYYDPPDMFGDLDRKRI